MLHTKTLHLPHLVTEAIYGGSGGPGTIYTPGGLEGTYAQVRDSGLGEALATVGLFVAWDRRFAANASGPFSLQSLESNGFDLLHVMEAFDLQKPNLVGSSFGTSISLTFAYWMAERVNKLVLLHPTRLSGVAHYRQIMDKIQGWKALLQEVGVSQALQQEGFCYSFSPDRDDLAGGRVGDMDPVEFGLLLEATYGRLGTEQLPILGLPRSMIQRIEHEALVFPGDDEVHPPAAADELAELLPHARLTRVREGDPAWEAALAGEVVAFLRE